MLQFGDRRLQAQDDLGQASGGSRCTLLPKCWAVQKDVCLLALLC